MLSIWVNGEHSEHESLGFSENFSRKKNWKKFPGNPPDQPVSGNFFQDLAIKVIEEIF